MKKFQVFFKDGDSVIIEGKNIVNALMNNYYDNSIVNMIESYKETK